MGKLDRHGQERGKILQVEGLKFVAFYGSYIVGDAEEIRLDKVTEIQVVD